MIESVTLDNVIYAGLPEKYEAGTPNIAGAIGLKAAIDYVQNIGLEQIYHSDKELCVYTLECLCKLGFVDIVCPDPTVKRVSAVSFNVRGVHAHDTAQVLADCGVAIRGGHHCAQPLHKALGIPASARISFGIYNDFDDVDRAIEALKQVNKIFG